MNYYLLPFVLYILGLRITSIDKSIKLKEPISMQIVFFLIQLSIGVLILIYP